MGTVHHPTAGYIADISHGAGPGVLPPAERDMLRGLALRVRGIAEDPRQEGRRLNWRSHGSLKSTRPMLLVFPEDSWIEIIGEHDLRATDPFWRQWEWYLRHLVWRHKNLQDDFVTESILPIPLVTRRGGWGMEPRYARAGEKGSYVWDAPLVHPEQISSLTFPSLQVDEAETAHIRDAVSDAFQDILPVKVTCTVPGINLIGEATMLRGLEQCLVDMYDNPEFLHRLMDFIGRGFHDDLSRLEVGGHLTMNNGNHYTDSGGIGYTDDLPGPASGAEVRLADLWGHGVAQELSGVGPVQHEEFVLDHQMPLLDRFGLVAYGCCEPYTKKFDMLKRRIRALRRVSVSPWCDLDAAAEALENRFIFSWKPSPAMLADRFHPDQVRAYIRDMLTRTRGCIVEISLKDTFTIQREPWRVIEWSRIAREEIERAS